MRSSGPISLFDDQAAPRPALSPFAVSLLLHAAAGAVVLAGFARLPRVVEPATRQRFAVRRLDLNRLDLHQPEASHTARTEANNYYPGPSAGSGSTEADDRSVDRLLRQIPRGVEGPQTLIQPNLRVHAHLTAETPIPAVAIWAPELASTAKIVAPLPDKPTAAPTTPSLDAPNQEINLASVGVTSVQTPPRPAPISAGTTSPLTSSARSDVQLPPVTVSNSNREPTPTAVLSVSDVRMTEGTIVLPPVNETHSSTNAGQLAPGAEQASAANPRTGTMAGKGSGGPPQSVAAVLSASANARASESAEHIVLPKDGKFGVVVVGSSLAEEYPEALRIWNSRVAYTTYIHVGLTKNWILQYSLLRSEEVQSAGMVAKLEAPWPYDMLRPNLTAAGLNADALMIHGIVDAFGRFEQLAVAFPSDFPRRDIVLEALRQWQFRPARQGGRAVAVEILLIIPDEGD